MTLKDMAALYGRVAFVMIVFAFVAGIIAGPLLAKSGSGASVADGQNHAPAQVLIRAKVQPVAGGQG